MDMFHITLTPMQLNIITAIGVILVCIALMTLEYSKKGLIIAVLLAGIGVWFMMKSEYIKDHCITTPQKARLVGQIPINAHPL
jgi:hypothetical protein